jgi:hypothetical protein
MCSNSFYDILVYSKSLEEHLHHPQLVLQLLAQDKWQVKRSKCSFAQGKIVCLGHVISTEGVSIDPKKIVAIQSWPTPENLTHLRSFLGLVGYYKKFVKNFGVICKPLTELLKKKTMFILASLHQQAFSALKDALVEALVWFCLISPNNSKSK